MKVRRLATTTEHSGVLQCWSATILHPNSHLNNSNYDQTLPTAIFQGNKNNKKPNHIVFFVLVANSFLEQENELFRQVRTRGRWILESI